LIPQICKRVEMTGTKLPQDTKKTSLALALVSGISAFAVLAGPANALTLMDFLKGGPGKSRAADNGVPGVTTVAPTEKALADPEPLPKVSGPRYYTYKADASRAVQTAGFAAASATDATRLIAQAKVSAPSAIASALEAYYSKNAAPLWVSGGDVNDHARALISVLEKAADFGLDPADYALKVPNLTTASVAPAEAPVASAEAEATVDPATPSAAAPEAATATPVAATPDTATTTAETPAVASPAAGPAEGHDRDLMQFELALSAKALLFAQDMTRGRIDPNKISGFHDFKLKTVDLNGVMAFLATGQEPGAYLAGLAPQDRHFTALKAELVRLRAEAASEATAVKLPDNLLLKPGNSSPDLSAVVAAIQHSGSDALKTKHEATLASYQQTPEYTPELVDLVKTFQSEAGLKADGVIGAATVRKMVGHTSQDKIEKLVVAMEQARWLPSDLGQRYVFINQPAFRVYYNENGAEQFSMRTVVGSKAHQTFFFQDEIETVEFNPYWGVPQSIIVNEMLPKLRADPSYLDRLGYEVAVNGKAVPSRSVNWYTSTQNVSVRQPPSSDNALGDLKILFPNAHAIYMHDTPSKSFFQRDMRALSHGCVRLAEPRKMAAAVLGISEQEVDARIAGGENVAAKVTAKIPVYVSYFTAWPNKDGKVEYFDDVYDRDAAVRKAFEATTKARSA
jgi:murein L,D-transpeptidase YcbB/YkuD